MIAEIIIDIQNKQVNRSFDYLIPSYLDGIVLIGSRVIVPFGKLKRTGYVINIKETTEYKNNIKEIIDVIDIKRVLNEEFIGLAKYIAENNFSFYATALDAMIPTALKIKYQKIVKLNNYELLNDACKELFKKRKELVFDNLDNDKQKLIFEEIKNNNVIIETKVKCHKDKEITMLHLLDEAITPSSKKGKELLNFLIELQSDIELSVIINDMGFSKSTVDTLAKLGIISLYKKEYKEETEVINIPDKIVNLTLKQKEIFNEMKYDSNNTYLLHGVTGSGKTELYMRWIDEVLKNNKKAIMLVPEISLTPQITSVLQGRFKNNISILHSRLTIYEKYEAWKKIINNEVNIVIGARSAIFAPIDNLGIIIIDECHEGSYYQQNNPKYSAIEIAKLRSKYHNCPLVLGSATPNINDYYYAINNDYKLLELPERSNGKKLPDIEVIDLRNELLSGNRSVLSKRLQEELIKTYNKKEQSILFINRRGYSSFVMCRSCGATIKCPHCDVSLTFHATTNSLKCHYCGYTTPNVSRCKECGSDKIRFVGSGTEKIIEAVNTLIPGAKLLRMDMDTTKKIEDYEGIYQSFKNHEADVLIGTQMLTKGLDFENVTLVGIVNADLALYYPKYDSTMIAFNLIEQVSGRAGRASKDGKVILQTYNPDHYVIRCAKKHDYNSFFNEEIKRRKLQLLPPFSSIIEILISSENKELCKKEANHIKDSLLSVSISSLILGPVEAPMFKRRDKYYYQIQIQAVEDSVIEKIKYIYPLYQNNKDIELSITREE